MSKYLSLKDKLEIQEKLRRLKEYKKRIKNDNEEVAYLEEQADKYIKEDIPLDESYGLFKTKLDDYIEILRSSK
ncbi:MAG: hypothetical protein LBD17_02740 [Endomicrobium sp.]|jgi:hypothetical protein|nr:hypothetical protein [Endomicrobium sp.]